MEKKRKIWVRLGAFMAALICCVLCVVPAYAAEGDMTQEELAATIAEQEERLNRLVRHYDFTFDYATYLQSVGKTYNDVTAVGKVDSDFPTYGYNNAYWNSTSGMTTSFVVWVQVRNSANEVVWERQGLSVTELYMSSRTLSENNRFYFRYATGGYRYFRMHFDQNGEWVKCDVGGATSNSYIEYLCADGYRFTCSFISTDTKVNPWLEIGCSRAMCYMPGMLLGLDTSAGNDEIYNQGYQHGYEIGFFDGETYGYDGGLVAGREEGYTEGDADGYRRGYDDGMHQTSLIEGIKSLFRAPMEFIESVLDFEIFGIDLGDAVKALVSMMLLALVITVVWKAVK